MSHEHPITGSPHDRMRAVVARHLCGWISGHSAPADHFLADADLILADAVTEGLRFHMVGSTSNDSDGFIELRMNA